MSLVPTASNLTLEIFLKSFFLCYAISGGFHSIRDHPHQAYPWCPAPCLPLPRWSHTSHQRRNHPERERPRWDRYMLLLWESLMMTSVFLAPNLGFQTLLPRPSLTGSLGTSLFGLLSPTFIHRLCGAMFGWRRGWQTLNKRMHCWGWLLSKILSTTSPPVGSSFLPWFLLQVCCGSRHTASTSPDSCCASWNDRWGAIL